MADLHRLIGDTALADETPESLDRNRSLAQVIGLLAEE
jgi:hypothetical protein